MISIAELKAELGLMDTTEHDVRLADLEASAVAFVEQQSGVYFGPVASRIEHHDGTGGVALFLDRSPISGTVVVQRRTDAIATAEAVATGEYAVRGRKLVMPGGWGYSEYEITFNEGYAPGAEPEDIRGAVRELVKLAFKRNGMKSETIGGYSYTLGDAEELGIQQTIEAHRPAVVA